MNFTLKNPRCDEFSHIIGISGIQIKSMNHAKHFCAKKLRPQNVLRTWHLLHVWTQNIAQESVLYWVFVFVGSSKKETFLSCHFYVFFLRKQKFNGIICVNLVVLQDDAYFSAKNPMWKNRHYCILFKPEIIAIPIIVGCNC